MIPFAGNLEQRRASGDPRQPLEERDGSYDSCATAVKKAAAHAVAAGFLLQEDAAALTAAAEENALLR